MNSYYLIRLDDACPTMNHKKWAMMESILDKYGVKPMVGVIPHNEDPKQKIDPENDGFWELVHNWEKNGWAIALHGYNHCYSSNEGLKGLNPMWRRSEFAGVSLKEQKEKIRKGVAIIRRYGINPMYFFPPSHTFDNDTLEALRSETNIRIVSDTIGRYPCKKGAFWFIPQIAGHCVKIPLNGIYTFCFHPNTMDDKAFWALESFLKDNFHNFISFDQIDLEQYGKKLLFDRFLSWIFFLYRRMRGLR